eukprot:60741-Chlamydomonas_euryale.AAC.1
MLDDPGAFVLLGYVGSGAAANVIDQWCDALDAPPDAVVRLVSRQPALLEMSPNTVGVGCMASHGCGCAWR